MREKGEGEWRNGGGGRRGNPLDEEVRKGKVLLAEPRFGLKKKLNLVDPDRTRTLGESNKWGTASRKREKGKMQLINCVEAR